MAIDLAEQLSSVFPAEHDSRQSRIDFFFCREASVEDPREMCF
jgi:hypothetical protein